MLSQLHLEPKGYALATLYRAENTDDPKRLAAVFNAFEAIAEQDGPRSCARSIRERGRPSRDSGRADGLGISP